MNFLNNKKNINLLLGGFLAVIFVQAFFIAKLYTEKDNKNYEVNLVAINTKKDSVDYSKMKSDLGLINNTVRELHSFLISKNIADANIETLAQDSLNNVVYLAKQSNRYSEYLVNLQTKLQQVPLGMPTDGYISSNFGTRKNPIPVKTKMLLASVVPFGNSVSAKNDTVGNSSKNSAIKSQNNAPSEADQMQFHKGLDIAVGYGSDVKCAAAGKVIFAGQKGGYGNCVIISHGNGLDTLYGHLSQIVVKTNDEVKVGQVIAKSGNTGRSTGPHLHYEVHKNGTPVNPKFFLNI